MTVDYETFVNDRVIKNTEESFKVKFSVTDYGSPVDLNLYVNGELKKKMSIKIYEKTDYKIP